MVLPELLRRVGTFDAHAAHHAHFGTVSLSLGAVGDRQRHAGVVIGGIETGDQIEPNETVHVTRSPRSCARSRSRLWRAALRSVIAAPCAQRCRRLILLARTFQSKQDSASVFCRDSLCSARNCPAPEEADDQATL